MKQNKLAGKQTHFNLKKSNITSEICFILLTGFPKLKFSLLLIRKIISVCVFSLIMIIINNKLESKTFKTFDYTGYLVASQRQSS